MTNTEKLSILEAATVRAYEELERFGKDDFNASKVLEILQAIPQMEYLHMSIVDRLRCLSSNDILFPENPVPVNAEVVSEPVVAEVKITPVVEAEPEKPTMSKEEVRDKLSTYSNKYDHLDVAAIMSEMGYSKLSDIPAARYAELLEKVEAAIKEGA